MPAIDPASLAPELARYATVLAAEGEPCRYLHYGLRAMPGANADAADSCQAMQQRFCELLLRQVLKGLVDPAQVLLAGPSLGELAQRLQQAGHHTRLGPALAWLQQPDLAAGSARATDAEHASDGFDRIVLEGSYHYLDQLGILSRCRQLLGEGGRILIFAEFLDDDSRIEHSPLPNLSSFRQLSRRLSFEILAEQDLSADAEASLTAFQRLLTQQADSAAGPVLARDEGAELSASLRRIQAEFAEGRRCFRLFTLHHTVNDKDEYAAAEYGDIHCFQPQEVASLFEDSFDTAFNPELWRWKYELGDGKCVVAHLTPGAPIVSHYGGAPRKIRYFGKPSMAIQVCDVMVTPSLRKQFGKNSLFFKTAATFLEREIGNTVNHLLGFGFPNLKAMHIAIRLGLYDKTDDFVELLLPAAPSEQPYLELEPAELDLIDPEHCQLADELWGRMLPDFDKGIIGVRDSGYLRYRYFDHPFAAAGRYRRLLLRECGGGSAVALAVLQPHGEELLLMDVVCPAPELSGVLQWLSRFVAGEYQGKTLKLWLTRGWLQQVSYPGVIERELAIEIPCNSWNPGPSAETLYGAWWLTAGDMDFM